MAFIKRELQSFDANDFREYNDDFLGIKIEADEISEGFLKKVKTQDYRKCPYLDTINRNYLDFDFEKLCSVSLTNLNVYACLVCGKFFQGRGKNTHAYTHSVQASHHVWINLNTNKIYCLPDNYEVIDSSLEDVQKALYPSFSPAEIKRLDDNTTLVRDVFGVSYLPGYIGLNNLRCTDFVNVVLHALAHVPPLRNFFLVPENYKDSRSTLVHRFGEVMRKIWSPHNFKCSVSPHEFVQEITVASKKRFRIGDQAECIDFLSWLLNSLHQGLGGTKKKNSSIIFKCFQGIVHLVTHIKKRQNIMLEDNESDSNSDEGHSEKKRPNYLDADDHEEWAIEEGEVPFLHLTLAIPQTPLFKDSQGGNIIPQVPLFTALEKFDGNTWTDQVKYGVHTRRQYRLQQLPQYLIFHLGRFTKNNFFREKNPTIVNFPVKNLELKDYVIPVDKDVPSIDELSGLSTADLKTLLHSNNISTKGCVERADIEERAKDFLIRTLPELLGTKYDLLANICHDSPPGQGKDSQMDPLKCGSYRAHVYNKASEQWYEIQDLHVQETMPQLIGLSESYIMIYERKRTAAENAAKLAAEVQAIIHN